MVLVLLLAALTIPLELDLYMPVPEDNPLTAEKIELGRRLFSDRRLSRDESIACSSCHEPDRAFSDGRAVPVGAFRASRPSQRAGPDQSRLRAHVLLGRPQSIA
jgi:cytochrome c peroxidase